MTLLHFIYVIFIFNKIVIISRKFIYLGFIWSWYDVFYFVVFFQHLLCVDDVCNIRTRVINITYSHDSNIKFISFKLIYCVINMLFHTTR